MDEQRYGVDAVEGAIDANDENSVQQAFAVFQWGFQQQQEDGGFAQTKDYFHASAFFLEAVARALVILKENKEQKYQTYLDTYIPKLHTAGLWLIRPDVAAKGNEGDQPFTHRRWNMAAALGLIAELTQDKKLSQAAERYAIEGLAI